MAVKRNKEESSLTLSYNYVKDGKDAKTNQRFSKVKLTAADEGLYNVGINMAPIINTPSIEIKLLETFELYDE